MSERLKISLLTLFVCLLNVTTYAQQNVSASGIVRSKGSLKPISFARVNVVKDGDTLSSVFSDKQGKFIFYQLPDGIFDFVVTGKGFSRKTLFAQKVAGNQPLSILIDVDSLPQQSSQQPGPVSNKPVVRGTKVQVVGTVRDSAYKVINGVNILVAGTHIGTATDENGRFILDVPVKSNLILSFVGYATDTIFNITTPKTLNVIMHHEVTAIGDEVVVTAFGEKRKKEALTAAITTINPENLKIPASNLTSTLAGQVPGIIAYQPSGQPGYDNAQFFIRGVATFGYSASPLILIDNIESSSSDLARLQVDDIGSFSILKDASATALYGARGANGVLLISTKKGNEKKTQVSLRVENSMSTPTQNLSLADPVTYMNLYNEAQLTRNPATIPAFDANKIYNTSQTLINAKGSNALVYPAVNWLDMLFKKKTSNQRANLSFRGGGKAATYFISGSYNLDNGILKVSPVNNFNNNVKLQSTQFRSNIDINLSKSTVLSLLLNGVFTDYNGPITSDPSGSSDLWNNMMYASPVLFAPYYLPDSANIYATHILFGNATQSVTANGVSQYDNPYADLLKGYSSYTQSQMNAQINLNQNLNFITPGLKFNGRFYTQRYAYFNDSRQYLPFYYDVQSYDHYSNQYTLNWINNLPGQASASLNYVPGTRNISSQIYFDGSLSYRRSFGKHRIDATAIATRQQTLQTSTGNGDGVNTALQLSLPHRNLNTSGRISYSYDDRYIIEPSFAYNGSERFAAGNRYGFFSTIGAAWNISREKFWENSKISKIITRLKLRGSYGQVGYDAIAQARFFYLSSVNLSGGAPATFGVNGIGTLSLPGVSVSYYANPNISWEKSLQANVGLEATLFNSLNFTVDVYKNRRSNIYQTRVDIASMGFENPGSVAANLGTATSQGMELQLDYAETLNRNWSFAARGNFTYAVSKYGKYEEPQYPYPWMSKSGTLINQQFGYVAQRLFVDNAEVANSPKQNFGSIGPMGGDIKYKDISGDGQISSFDKVPMGYPTVPEITYGFGGSARYKRFDVNFFFQGNAMVSFFINPSQVSPFIPGTDASGNSIPGSNAQVLSAFAKDHWSLQNQNLYALYPRLATTAAAMNNNLQNSSWWLRDGQFLRLKTLEIGYTLSDKLLKRSYMNNCRIYFNGLNLFTIRKFKLWDVEQGGNGFAYPIQKVYNVGINLSF